MAEMSQQINFQTLFSIKTDYSADSVEWCPHDPNKNVFVCANYQLQKNELSVSNSEKQQRVGKILLFSVDSRDLKLCQTIDTSAVLDQKWCHIPYKEASLLGVVNAKGTIELYKLNSECLKLELLCFYKIDPEGETLILSLDWSTGILQSNEPEIVCSDSKGNIHLLRLTNDKLILEDTFHGHGFEAWIASFYYFDPNIFFTGGDDSLFLKFDKRTGKQPIAKNKSHLAGVTSFHSNYSKEFLVASGSYDEFIRLWDIRNLKSETCSVRMPGTLWRLKWNPFENDYLLAACMLGGVHVVNATSGKIEIVGSYNEHKDIAYGADWSYLSKDNCSFVENDQFVVGSCSFYDNLLCVSKYCKTEVSE